MEALALTVVVDDDDMVGWLMEERKMSDGEERLVGCTTKSSARYVWYLIVRRSYSGNSDGAC